MTDTIVKLLAMITLTLLLAACFGGSVQALSPTVGRIQDLNERALHSMERQQFDQARSMLDKALSLATSLDDGQQQALTLLNLARLERRLGRFEQAELLLDRGWRTAADTGYEADLAQETALLKIARNNLPEAEHWAGIALKEEQGGMSGRRLNLLARIALLKNSCQEALRLAEQALENTSSSGMAEERANSLRIIGQIKGREKHFEEAQRLLYEALAIDRQQERPLKIAADLEALALLMEMKGDGDKGREYRQRAQMVRKNSAVLFDGL